MLGQSSEREVVVKIIDPSLRRTIDMDLCLMRAVSHLVELIPRVHWLSLSEAVDEFGKLMETQVSLQVGREPVP